ncbi:hypothetical protein BDR22DRAFT_876537 [Usnea florida]
MSKEIRAPWSTGSFSEITCLHGFFQKRLSVAIDECKKIWPSANPNGYTFLQFYFHFGRQKPKLTVSINLKRASARSYSRSSMAAISNTFNVFLNFVLTIPSGLKLDGATKPPNRLASESLVIGLCFDGWHCWHIDLPIRMAPRFSRKSFHRLIRIRS